MSRIGETDKSDKRLLLLDRDYNHVGLEEKEKCHDGDGILHLAYLVTLFGSN